MKITSAIYVQSCVLVDQCPKPDKPEFAFIGRSNVGKSSLINMLTTKEGLAKVSGRPGKTQVINHFVINNKWFLVDLPGYGYAKVSKEKRAGFDKMISNYILKRDNLVALLVLIDVRIPPQELDLNFLRNLGENQVPFSIVFTKCDKLGSTTLKKNVETYKKTLLKEWEEVPNYFLTSSETGMGKKEVLSFIGESLKYFEPGLR